MYPTVSLSWELVSGIHKISDTFRITTGMGFQRNSRIKTLPSQRNLKGELTHICHFKVEETVGDLDSSEVTKLMLSSATTRMQTFGFLNQGHLL